jgi:hypothetical protein
MRLHRNMVRGRTVKRVLVDTVRFPPPLLDITVAQLPRAALVTGIGVVELGCVRQRRLVGVRDIGQFFVINVNEIERLGGDLGGLSHHHRDGVADVANAVDGDDRLVIALPAVVRRQPAIRSQVGSGQDRHDTGQCLGGGGIDAPYPGVGKRAAEHLGVRHPR